MVFGHGSVGGGRQPSNQDEVKRAAERLGEALVGDDVLVIDHDRWQTMARSSSPHRRAIRAQAIRLHPEP